MRGRRPDFRWRGPGGTDGEWGVLMEPLSVDVREDLRAGREPFGKIMQAAGRLAPGQALILYATFEPVPLLRVMESKGFGHQSREIGGGDWEVRFEPPD